MKRRFPFYANVHVSISGLQFEYPEPHFLRDIETGLPELRETRTQMTAFSGLSNNAIRERNVVAPLVAKERFLSRSIISAGFSLTEAFLSGTFFTAVHTKSVGTRTCDEDFLKFATAKESAAPKDRLDRVVRFASGADEPFKSLLDVGKRYWDAIHHTTLFQRKDIEPGGRLAALYEIDGDIALTCVILSASVVLQICEWINPTSEATDIAARCQAVIQMALPTRGAEGARAMPTSELRSRPAHLTQ